MSHERLARKIKELQNRVLLLEVRQTQLEEFNSIDEEED